MRLKNVMPVVVALVSAACAVGDAPPADENPQTTVQAASGGPGWSPHSPWTKQQLENLCDDPEWFPSTPPEMGKCTIEVRLTESSFVNGQGVSEGRGEISLVATADPLDTAGLPTTLAATGIEIYNPEQTNSQSLNLGTYEVAVGSQERVRVCVDFTEHDGGGANGGDDLATGCTTLVLRCSGQDLNGDSVPDGFAGASGTVGPVQLCGDNQCNGWVSAGVEALAADADMDGVENDEDFTPELCDEAEKGENGLGLITYYHFGDDWLTSLFQGIGTGVASTYAPYDFVILVSDQDASNPANVNAAMFRNADLVLPPTRDGLMDAMREMTRRGLRFDMNVFSHGHGSGPDDADFETISGGQITGDWLVGAAQPDQTGTPFGGIPLMAWWSTTCIAARQIDAWIDIGGIVASGAVNIQFNANTLGSYFGAWSGGDTYKVAVDDSVTFTSKLAVEALITQEGKAFPWFCRNNDPNHPGNGDGPGHATGLNPCAEDFFNDSLGLNAAKYNIEDTYDTGVSGAVNMQLSSARDFVGNTSVVFGAPGHTWP